MHRTGSKLLQTGGGCKSRLFIPSPILCVSLRPSWIICHAPKDIAGRWGKTESCPLLYFPFFLQPSVTHDTAPAFRSRFSGKTGLLGEEENLLQWTQFCSRMPSFWRKKRFSTISSFKAKIYFIIHFELQLSTLIMLKKIQINICLAWSNHQINTFYVVLQFSQ